MMTTGTGSTVFVVDDEDGMRSALRRLFGNAGFNVETFPGAREFLQAYSPERPGCIVLDVRMPEMTGPDLQKALTAQGIEIPIIFLTAYSNVPLAVDAMKSGAVDFLEKPFQDEILVERVGRAIELDVRMREDRMRRAEARHKLALLTVREREVLDRVVAGKPTKTIAAELNISVRTVDIHRTRIIEKTGTRSAAELLRLVMAAEGELSPNPI